MGRQKSDFPCRRGTAGPVGPLSQERDIMQVRSRQLRARLVAATAGLATAVLGATSALAGYGQPSPWQMTMQQSASPVMDDIIWFHDLLLWIVTAITIFVMVLLLIIIVRFN